MSVMERRCLEHTGPLLVPPIHSSRLIAHLLLVNMENGGDEEEGDEWSN